MEINYFTILWWFSSCIDKNQPRVYMCLPMLSPPPTSHHPPYSIPLGCPKAPCLSVLPRASNLHWSSILRIVIYMFQCHSLIRWMKLEPTIQGEVNQKEKHQYSILTHIYMELSKTITMTLHARQQKRPCIVIFIFNLPLKKTASYKTIRFQVPN